MIRNMCLKGVYTINSNRVFQSSYVSNTERIRRFGFSKTAEMKKKTAKCTFKFKCYVFHKFMAQSVIMTYLCTFPLPSLGVFKLFFESYNLCIHGHAA